MFYLSAQLSEYSRESKYYYLVHVHIFLGATLYINVKRAVYQECVFVLHVRYGMVWYHCNMSRFVSHQQHWLLH